MMVVTAEAQACGLPVVAFRSGGVPYTLDDGVTGLLVPEADEQQYFQALSDLINNPAKRQEMGRNARKFVEKNFSMKENCAKFLKIYDNLLNPQI